MIVSQNQKIKKYCNLKKFENLNIGYKIQLKNN